ncbi:MAG: PLDc N-terminal domain-containing protein [Actinobacteria bacterium]|nr:PLDc N-terminal domain-containing protein [Actinomycetota bacterium]
MRARSWSDLSRWQRAGILTLGSVELALTATAAVDLWSRPRTEVNGVKARWWPVLLIQPVGPVVYLLRGRRHPHRALVT